MVVHRVSRQPATAMYRPGHYGVTLLVTAPAVVVLDSLPGVAISVLAVSVSMLPDVDTRFSFLVHRGLTHTVAFAVAVAATGGVLAAVISWVTTVFTLLAFTVPPAVAFAYTAGSFFVGVVSHLLADALNPGIGTNALRPFWPFSRRVVRWNVAAPDSDSWNLGLLVAGILAQLTVHVVG